METIGIIGGGSFGSALADMIGTKGHPVNQWFRSVEAADRFNATRVNAKYLPSFTLSDNITATGDLEKVARSSKLLVVSVPSPHFREVARKLGDWVDGGQILVSTTKGIEAHSFKLMTEILREETCCLKIGALSGPNLAKEIAAKKPSGTVIASRYEEVTLKVQEVMSGPYFRVYSNSDVYGVELGGVLKNVYAIATGLITALKMGDNTMGMLITRALAEMSRFADKMGSNPLTFLGLAGVGDLVTTCTSPLSRNFRVGLMIGQGATLDEAVQKIGEVAEGVNTIRIVKEKAAHLGIRMHILEGLHALLFEGKDLPMVIKQLMNVPQMEDVEFAYRAGPSPG
ncbi:MAG: NAD(P)H-dependent glycerol-3-phosphate dehydrogenase [Fibrobacterota bacterium]|nr:NAD(P)H-dependent glycerol-3-phosphate dehydrogenase [Fibrobacterota bacterium]